MKKPEHKWGRMPEYMSPTAVQTFYDDVEEYYLRYLCADRPPKFPQTAPMSVGSAFDAYAKSHLHKLLFGNFGKGDQFRFEKIFQDQVEPQNRDFALKAGEECWEAYKFSGALSDLTKILQKSTVDPRFEFTIKGTVGTEGERRGVPLLGKPDIYLVVKKDDGEVVVIIDWKVNGYCSKRAVSPVPGYVMCRDGWSTERHKSSRSANRVHKDAMLGKVGPVEINLAKPLEQTDAKWALQIATYGWLMGVTVGSLDFVAGIDQLACGPCPDGGRLIRVAQHRAVIGRDFQHEALNRYVHAWEVINSDHIFRDMSRDESLAKCEMLDKRAAALRGDGSPEDDLFSQMTRRR